MRYRITTPVQGFTGVSAGVNFTLGVAEIEAPILPDLPEGKELTREERAEREEIAQSESLRQVNYFRAQGYGVEELDERFEDLVDEDDDEPFDPSEHDVPEVLAHLAEADEDEQARVIAAERDGKNRKTITERSAS